MVLYWWKTHSSSPGVVESDCCQDKQRTLCVLAQWVQHCVGEGATPQVPTSQMTEGDKDALPLSTDLHWVVCRRGPLGRCV